MDITWWCYVKWVDGMEISRWGEVNEHLTVIILFSQHGKPNSNPFPWTFILDRSALLIVAGDTFNNMIVAIITFHDKGSRAPVCTSQPAKVFLQPAEPVCPVFKLATGILAVLSLIFVAILSRVLAILPLN